MTDYEKERINASIEQAYQLLGDARMTLEMLHEEDELDIKGLDEQIDKIQDQIHDIKLA